ncbi:MAG: serine/threonine protein kinase [Myxococcales bacterium]|nr:serine/threonine protein kinase [Myxococcales bacterium]
MKRCPECGTEFPVNAGYCPMDGAVLVDPPASGGREGWRLVLPPLVRRREGDAEGDAAADEASASAAATSETSGAREANDAAATGAGVSASAEAGAGIAVDGAPSDGKKTASEIPVLTTGPRRPRVGRHMSLGAFAVVPRKEADPKQTIVAIGGAPRPGLGGGLAQLQPAAAVALGEPRPLGLITPKDAPPLNEEALVGRVLDQRYRIDAKIGAGGMGVVYRATHVIIDKPLAIKVLRSEHAVQHEVVQRFLLEAQLASQIKHPNVVDISDYGQLGVGAAAYYAMEFLSGSTLAQAIAAEGRLAPARAIDVAVQLARGLAAAHERGIVHRDLKPDNVFLCTGPDGQEQAKILDFGIARGLHKNIRLTAQGVLVGTPAYMAPEQAQSSSVDARADLYSLGIILFEMLTGRTPFGDRGPMETINQHLFAAPPGLQTVCADLPALPTIERVIRLLLAKDREERPGDAQKVISLLLDARDQDLKGALADAPVSGRRRVNTAALGSGSVGESLTAPIVDLERSGEETMVDDDALTRPRGDRAAVDEVLARVDVPQPRQVTPSGRIQKRPSVIVKRGTPVERFAPPPPRPKREEPVASELSADDLVRVPAGDRRSGPPMPLVIGVAAVVAMALTVSVWKYWPASESATTPVRKADEYVRLRFESSPTGAEILRGGRDVVGYTPIDFQVPRGDEGIVYVFRLPGHVDVARTVLPDRTQTVRAELNPARRRGQVLRRPAARARALTRPRPRTRPRRARRRPRARPRRRPQTRPHRPRASRGDRRRSRARPPRRATSSRSRPLRPSRSRRRRHHRPTSAS